MSLATGQQTSQEIIPQVPCKDVRRCTMGSSRSNAWKPANLLFTTDYDCTFTVQDTCELLVWAKENSSNIKDGRMIQVYESLWEEYEVVLMEQIAAKAGESAHDRTTGELTTNIKREVTLENFVKLGLDPRLEATIRASLLLDNEEDNETEASGSAVPAIFSDSSILRNTLRHLAGLERVINEKVIATGFLGGLRKEEIRFAGGRAPMQTHCLEFLSRLTALGTSIHVISANWSRDIIYGGLSSLPEERLYVHCNDLEFNALGESSGHFENRITNAIDKESIQQALRKLTSRTEQEKMVVYFGDAQTDLLALLDADLGVVMGQRAALRNLLDQNGIRLLPLAEAGAALSAGSVSTFRQTGTLFQATGWKDVEACLFGRDSSAEDFLTSKM